MNRHRSILDEVIELQGKSQGKPSQPVPTPSSNGQATAQAQSRKISNSTLLLKTVEEQLELFHDSEKNPYATFQVDDHYQTWAVGAKGFKTYLRKLFYAQYRTALNSQALEDALGVLAATAVFNGQQHPVNVRLAHHGDAIFLDLADAQWRVVKITAHGWEVTPLAPVKFRRPRGLLPLPLPTRGGSLHLLGDLLNLENESHWSLIIAWLIGTFSEGPFPLLCLHGEQGSAKSTAARLLRACVDPNVVPIRAEPKEIRDLMIAASNGHLVVFDNLSFLPNWLSDCLCRLSTGGGFSTRELYSDGEEKLFDAMRPVILTGISEVATRGDLLERSLINSLPSIPEDKRRTEGEIWAHFHEQHPAILGAILDCVAVALRNLPTVHLERLPRMADFAKWVVAAGPALGLEEPFMATYATNREETYLVAVEGDPIGEALTAFMRDITAWEGTASELLTLLSTLAGEKIVRGRDWPAKAHALSGRLKRLAPSFRRLGLDITWGRTRTAKRNRTIRIQKVGEKASNASNSVQNHEFP